MLGGVTTTYIGNYFEWTGSTSTMVKYYYAGGQRVAMRKGSTLTYLLGDQGFRRRKLGSTAISANSNGTLSSETRYHPWGGTRYSNGTAPTAYQYTGQRNDAGIGLYFYGARYYDPALGRFVQADSIVPGAADGAGGSVATLGYDSNTRLTPLTVNLGEFAMQINAENREVLQFGAFFQWDSETRQQHNVPMGPANPQALNRYAYCLNNPLRYIDPTGHQLFSIKYDDWGAIASALDAYISDINNNLWIWEAGTAVVFGFVGGAAGAVCGGPWGAGLVGAATGFAGLVTGKLLGGGFKADGLDVALKYINNGTRYLQPGQTFEIDFQWHAQHQVKGDFWSDDLLADLRIQIDGLSPRYIGLQAGLELLSLLGIDPASIETYNSEGERVNW